MKIDEMIKATKLCTKALMKLSYKNFQLEQNKIPDTQIKYNTSGDLDVYRRN